MAGTTKKMDDHYISYQQSRICYHTTGSGAPVVLLHGFAEDSSIWHNQVSFLQNGFRLILPDLPGCGLSDIIHYPKPAMEEYAALLKLILEKEKIRSCIMIGHSLGGYITLAFAEKHPAMLTAFGLFHSTAYADDETKRATRIKSIEFINKNGTEAFLRTSIPGLFYYPGNSTDINTLIEKGALIKPATLIQYYHGMLGRPDRSDILTNSRVPVLFIIGKYDMAVPFRHSLEQCHMPKKSHIHILRNSAHMGMLEEPGRSNEILANFLLNP